MAEELPNHQGEEAVMQPRNMETSSGQTTLGTRPIVHSQGAQEHLEAPENLSNHPSIQVRHARLQTNSLSTVSRPAAGTGSQYPQAPAAASHTSLPASPGSRAARPAHRAHPGNRTTGVHASTAYSATGSGGASFSVHHPTLDAGPADQLFHVPLASHRAQTVSARDGGALDTRPTDTAQIQRSFQDSVGRRNRVVVLPSNPGISGNSIARSGVQYGNFTTYARPAAVPAQATALQLQSPVPPFSRASSEVSGGRPSHRHRVGHAHVEGTLRNESCDMQCGASSSAGHTCLSPLQRSTSQADSLAAGLPAATGSRSSVELPDLSMFGNLCLQAPQQSQSTTTPHRPSLLKEAASYAPSLQMLLHSRPTHYTIHSSHSLQRHSSSDITVECHDWSNPGTGICSGSEGNSSSPASARSDRTSPQRTTHVSTAYMANWPTNLQAARLDLASPFDHANQSLASRLRGQSSEYSAPQGRMMHHTEVSQGNLPIASSRQTGIVANTHSGIVANRTRRTNPIEPQNRGLANSSSYLRRHAEQTHSSSVTSHAITVGHRDVGQEHETATVSVTGTRLPSSSGYQGSFVNMHPHQPAQTSSFLDDMTASEQQLLQQVEDAQLALAISRSLQDTGASISPFVSRQQSNLLLEDMPREVTDTPSVPSINHDSPTRPPDGIPAGQEEGSRAPTASVPSIYSRTASVSRYGRPSHGLRQTRTHDRPLVIEHERGTSSRASPLADNVAARHNLSEVPADAIHGNRLQRGNGSPVQLQDVDIRTDSSDHELLQRYERSQDLADAISDLLQQQARFAHSLANSLREQESVQADDDDTITGVIENPGRLSLDNPDGSPAVLPRHESSSERHVMSRSHAEALVAAVLEDGSFASLPRPQLRNRRRRGIDGREHPIQPAGSGASDLAALLSHAAHVDSDSTTPALSQFDQTTFNTRHTVNADNHFNAAPSQSRVNATHSSALTSISNILNMQISDTARIIQALRSDGRADWLLDLNEADDSLSYEWMSQLEDVKVPTPQHVLDRLPVTSFNRSSKRQACFDSPCCPICVDDFKEGDPVMMLPCKHGFHATCIKQWLGTYSKFCPVCKACVII